MGISNVFIVDPNDIHGITFPGQPSAFKYKDHLNIFKEALSEIDYVFASIIQLYVKGAIENTFPTLAVAFDHTKINSYESYLLFVADVSNRISEATNGFELPINLLVMDSREDYLNNFKTATSWTVAIKNHKLYSVSNKPWWKFW